MPVGVRTANRQTGRPAFSWTRLLGGSLVVLITTLLLLEILTRLLWWSQTTLDNVFGKEIVLLPAPLVSSAQLEALDAWIDNPDKYVQFDPILGWRVAPNIQTQFEGITYTSNSDGMRGLRDYSLEKPAGVIRIGTFGPSFTHGDEAPDDGTWQVQLEQARAELEVMNWGVGGYGTDQAFLRYQIQGAAYRPDIVIVGFEEENVRRNVNRFRPFYRPETGNPLTKPVFVEGEAGLVLLENPFGSVEALQQTLITDRSGFLDRVCPSDFFCDEERYQTRSLDYFYSYRFLRTLVYEIDRARQLQLPTEQDPYVQRINLLLIEQFVNTVVENGSLPILLVFPERRSMEAHEKGQSTAYEAGITMLRAQGLPVIDLAPAFVHAKRTDRVDYGVYYASEGGHFNALGNYIVSQAVLGYLCQQGVLKQC